MLAIESSIILLGGGGELVAVAQFSPDTEAAAYSRMLCRVIALFPMAHLR